MAPVSDMFVKFLQFIRGKAGLVLRAVSFGVSWLIHRIHP